MVFKWGELEGGDLLVLANFESVPLTNAVIDELKILAAEAVAKNNVKSAVLGITGIKRFLVKVYSQFSKDVPGVFSSYEDAVAYLVED
jgi:hypothetical protein